jgi:hypothetical protein
MQLKDADRFGARVPLTRTRKNVLMNVCSGKFSGRAEHDVAPAHNSPAVRDVLYCTCHEENSAWPGIGLDSVEKDILFRT